MSNFKVVDISAWQENLNWQALKRANIKGVIIKIGEYHHLDDMFTTHVNNAVAYNLPYGIYYYAHAATINEAIDMGAKRIGHGISCLEDKDTLKRIIDEKIVLEVCPTSNTHTGAVLKYQKHPIYNLYKKGVLVTVNTDNRTVSDITLTKEYSKLIENFGILKEDFINMNKTAIKNSFLKQMEKADLLEKYEEIENNTLE